MRARSLLPLGVFLLLALLLQAGLRLDPREIPSPLVGKPVPPFRLSLLGQTGRTFSPENAKGEAWLLNVWASWCSACLQEHPLLMELAESGELAIYGLGYKDRAEDARRWLERHGDPYTLALLDPDGRAGIDLGVYGVPESYLIDPDGVIRHKHIGPLTPEVVDETILPIVREMRR